MALAMQLSAKESAGGNSPQHTPTTTPHLTPKSAIERKVRHNQVIPLYIPVQRCDRIITVVTVEAAENNPMGVLD